VIVRSLRFGSPEWVEFVVPDVDEAKASFEKAFALTSQQQRRFLERRLAEIK